MEFDPSKCWEWTRATSGRMGYGVLSFYKRNYYAHRASYRLFVGEIPNGAVVCHRCDNPKCFNPTHLFIGTPADNVADMIAKGRHRSPDFAGSKNPRCKFSDELILQIRADFESGLCARDLRAAYPFVSHAQMYRITRYLTRPELKPGVSA